MTARTLLETLTLARDYLDSLLADSTKGPWLWHGHHVEHDNAPFIDCDSGEDGALIVALHATAPGIRTMLIDAQIRLTNRIMKDKCLDDRCRPKLEIVAIGIAEAILSTPHAAQWITEREAANTA